ncbi:MAG: iron ABC transporter permease [Planctomycetaceae bacterium]|nr:iron ABC transporter permease [Planctomycetaceae bacterium]
MTKLPPPPNLPRSKEPLTLAAMLSIPVEFLIAGLLFLLLIVPLGMVVASGFMHEGSVSGYWFTRVLGNSVLMSQLGNSVLLAAATTGLCLLMGIPLAVLRVRCRFVGQGLLGLLVLAPMILPPFVGALSLQHLASRFGSINLLLERIGLLDFSQHLPPDWLGGGFAGVAALQALHLFPILYLNAAAALANVDPCYSQAARNLGAGPLRTFLRITLPLMAPGLFAGATLVFIWSFTDVGVPLMLDYQHLVPVTIFKELARADTGGRTFCLVFVMLSSSITLYALGKFLFGRSAVGEASKASIADQPRHLGLAGTLGAWLLMGGLAVLALAPHAGVVLMALSDRWVNTVLPTKYTLSHMAFVVTDPATYASIVNSLKYALAATGIDVVLGIAIAFLVVRIKVPLRGALDSLAMLPLAVPGLILAAGYVALTASGPLKSIGPMGNPFIILVVAYAVRRLPFMVRGASAGLTQVPPSLEEAARNLGASPASAAARITLPLIAANLIAAAVLTFAFSVLEVSDSLILAQLPQHYPITKQIFNLATSAGSPETPRQAAALGVYGMAMLGATMAAAAALLGKRLGAIFRA